LHCGDRFGRADGRDGYRDRFGRRMCRDHRDRTTASAATPSPAAPAPGAAPRGLTGWLLRIGIRFSGTR
jgi:hypothetical protein